MVKRILVIMLVIGLMVFVLGCQGNKTDTTTKGKVFIGGADSIEFDFLEGAPPAEVFDRGNFPFDVTLNLENKGEYDVASSDIEVKLLGFYAPDFNNPTTAKNLDENLNGAYIDSDGNKIAGDVSYVNFPNFNFVGNLVGNNEYTIRADVCYKYGTKAQTDMCIFEDLTKLGGKVCKIDEKKTVESSSAPVKAENFEENVAGSEKITFSFEIVHRGTGAISAAGSKCDDALGSKNKVYVSVNNGLSGLSCSGLDGGTTEGYVTLYGGKRLVRCTQDTTGLTGDFEKKVSINLEYDYKEHKDTKVMVKHSTE